MAGAASEVVLSLGISDSSNRIMLAGLFDKGIFRSEDGGNSWNEANQGLTAHYLIGSRCLRLSDRCYHVCMSPSENSPLSGWRTKLAASVERVEAQYPFHGRLAPLILMVAVCWHLAGIVHSLDRGSSANDSLEQEEISFLAVSDLQDRTLAAGAGSQLPVYDGGNNWETLGLPSEDEVLTALAIASILEAADSSDWLAEPPLSRGRLRVWARTLPGSSWVLISTYTNSRITTLGIPDSYDQNERFFVGNGDCVYRSLPGARERTREGTTSMWLPAGVGSRKYPVVALDTSPHFSRSQTLLAVAGDSVHYSNNQGVKWQRLGTPVGDRFPISIALSPKFDRNGIVYALTIGGQLWVWDPKGSTKTA